MPEIITFLDPISDDRANRLRALLPAGFSLTYATESGDDHLKELISEADFAVAAQVNINNELLKTAKHLKLLHKWGVGVDNIDIEAARNLGIKVARTTGSNAIPVAEFAIGLMLSALRCIPYGHAELKNGRWRDSKRLPLATYMLSGKTVGIIGFGAIGQTIAKLLSGFGCNIIYHKRIPLSRSDEASTGATYACLNDLLSTSDIVSLNCPLTPETKGLIDHIAISRMKSTSIIINAARGGIVVENDLFEALRDRKIHAAAMDVFEIEPMQAGHPLLTLDNIVLTPHLAAAAADNFERTVRHFLENIAKVSRGESISERDMVA